MGEITHGKLARGGTCTVCALQVQATNAVDGLRLFGFDEGHSLLKEIT